MTGSIMRFLTCISLTALLLTLLACSGGNKGGFSARSSEKQSGVLKYPLPTNPTSLDPAKVQDGDTIDVVQQVFEGLVKWGENNAVVPNLAQEWKISEDGTLYTFFLKKGVKFSNGRALKAEDFKWSIERACNPKYTSPTAGTYLADIIGVKERLAGKAEEVVGIKVVDDSTLTIKIDKPRPYFLGKLTYACAYAVAKEGLKDPLSDMVAPEEMIGTGPFKMEKIVPESIVVLAANRDYHSGAPELDKIERPVIKDAQSRLNKYKAGDVDMIQLERSDLPSIQADSKLKNDLKFFDRPSMFYVGLNVNAEPVLKNVKVRQAIAYAIDRDKIVAEILGGINKKANSILPPNIIGYRDGAPAFPYDVAKAKALLAEAGYADGKGFPEIEFNYRDGRPDIEIVAQAVQQQLKQNLGITFSPRKMEWASYLTKHNSRKMAAFHMRWAADYLDPENFLSTLLASYGNENKVNFNNAEYDALCREADGILDEKKRLELYQKAENIVLSEAPFIPLYYQKDIELISGRVSGLRESAFGHLPHTATSVK
jgi:oligopeptide transport system substrate-binding protein